jgi:hypothetical protein
VDVAWPQGAPPQVAVLVEHEEWMIAGAGEVAAIRGAFLRAVRLAHAAVDVDHEGCSCTPHLCAVDPAPDRSANAVKFVSEVIALVSKRPIWLVDGDLARPEAAPR